MSSLLEPRPPGTREVAGVFILGEKSAVLVRAGNYAVPAADANIIIHIDNAVRPFLGGFGRANFHAWCVLALIAADRKRSEFLAGHISFPGYQTRPVHPQRKKVFNPASGDAGVAASALCQIYHHTPSHQACSLFGKLNIKYQK
jgi:hypothetical protein